MVALVLHMQRQDCLPGALVDEDDFSTPTGDPLPSARFTDTRFAAVRAMDGDSDDESIVDDADGEGGFDGSSLGRASSLGGDDDDTDGAAGGPGRLGSDSQSLVSSTRSILGRRRRNDGLKA